MEVTIKKAYPLMLDTLRAGLIPYLKSSPGIGKSDLVKLIAEENNLFIKDIRLAQCDPTDLAGFPSLIDTEKTEEINGEIVITKSKRSGYSPPEDFPLETDPLPLNNAGVPYKGWLILFDELSSAPLATQAAAYKIFLDRMVGQHKLHPNVAMVAAGNLATDKAVVNRMSTAMQSRLIHVKLKVDIKSWIEWAYKHDIDNRVIGFLNFRAELLHKFDPNSKDDTFPCPRTWEFISKIIKPWSSIDEEKLPLLIGTVGEGAAMEFQSFSTIFNTLPTIEEILKNPNNVRIPSEPSTMYAFSSLLARFADKTNIKSIMTVLKHIPIEFQVLSIRGIFMRDKSLKNDPNMKQWVSLHANDLI